MKLKSKTSCSLTSQSPSNINRSLLENTKQRQVARRIWFMCWQWSKTHSKFSDMFIVPRWIHIVRKLPSPHLAIKLMTVHRVYCTRSLVGEISMLFDAHGATAKTRCSIMVAGFLNGHVTYNRKQWTPAWGSFAGNDCGSWILHLNIELLLVLKNSLAFYI